MASLIVKGITVTFVLLRCAVLSVHKPQKHAKGQEFLRKGSAGCHVCTDEGNPIKRHPQMKGYHP